MQVAEEAGAAASGDDERGQRVTNLLKGGVLFVKVRFQGFMVQGPVPSCCVQKSGDNERGQRVTNLLKGGVLFVKVCFPYPLGVTIKKKLYVGTIGQGTEV